MRCERLLLKSRVILSSLIGGEVAFKKAKDPWYHLAEGPLNLGTLVVVWVHHEAQSHNFIGNVDEVGPELLRGDSLPNKSVQSALT